MEARILYRGPIPILPPSPHGSPDEIRANMLAKYPHLAAQIPGTDEHNNRVNAEAAGRLRSGIEGVGRSLREVVIVNNR